MLWSTNYPFSGFHDVRPQRWRNQRRICGSCSCFPIARVADSADISCVAPNAAVLIRHRCRLRSNQIDVNPSSFRLLSVRDAPIAACCDYNHNATVARLLSSE